MSAWEIFAPDERGHPHPLFRLVARILLALTLIPAVAVGLLLFLIWHNTGSLSPDPSPLMHVPRQATTVTVIKVWTVTDPLGHDRYYAGTTAGAIPINIDQYAQLQPGSLYCQGHEQDNLPLGHVGPCTNPTTPARVKP